MEQARATEEPFERHLTRRRCNWFCHQEILLRCNPSPSFTDEARPGQHPGLQASAPRFLGRGVLAAGSAVDDTVGGSIATQAVGSMHSTRNFARRV